MLCSFAPAVSAPLSLGPHCHALAELGRNFDTLLGESPPERPQLSPDRLLRRSRTLLPPSVRSPTDTHLRILLAALFLFPTVSHALLFRHLLADPALPPHLTSFLALLAATIIGTSFNLHFITTTSTEVIEAFRRRSPLLPRRGNHRNLAPQSDHRS
jgi:hypothetical protein